MRLILQGRNFAVCETCGQPAEWVDKETDERKPPPETAVQWLTRRRVGHDKCDRQEERARVARAEADFMEARLKREAAAADGRRRRLADEIGWPLERMEELQLHKCGLTRIANWTPKSPRGVLVFGMPGVGKTFALRCLAAWTQDMFGLTPHWMNVNRWLQKMRHSLDKVDGMLEQAEKADVLFVDDLGAEKITEWSESLLEQVFSVRFDHRRPVFVSSNFPPAAFLDRFGPRVTSRLSGLCDVVQLTGPDRRPLDGKGPT